MKREAVSHTKMGRLMRHLKLRRFQAVGLCEMLWHTAAREAPEGDIGKLTDEDIAIALDWNREPGDLIGGFTHAGLIDEHTVHRLIIHDWAEHAEDSVHSKIARSKRFFCDGKAPKITGLRKADAEAAATFYANNPAATPAQPVANPSSTTNQPVANPSSTTNQALPSQALPSLTKPSQSKTHVPDGTDDSDSEIGDAEQEQPSAKLALVAKQPSALQAATTSIANAIWGRHPEHRRSPQSVVELRLRQRVKDIPNVEEKIKRMREIDARHARWCASDEWAGRGIVSNLGNWFTRGICMNEPEGAQLLFQPKHFDGRRPMFP